MNNRENCALYIYLRRFLVISTGFQTIRSLGCVISVATGSRASKQLFVFGLLPVYQHNASRPHVQEIDTKEPLLRYRVTTAAIISGVIRSRTSEVRNTPPPTAKTHLHGA